MTNLPRSSTFKMATSSKADSFFGVEEPTSTPLLLHSTPLLLESLRLLLVVMLLFVLPALPTTTFFADDDTTQALDSLEFEGEGEREAWEVGRADEALLPEGAPRFEAENGTEGEKESKSTEGWRLARLGRRAPENGDSLFSLW